MIGACMGIFIGVKALYNDHRVSYINPCNIAYLYPNDKHCSIYFNGNSNIRFDADDTCETLSQMFNQR